MLEPLFDKVSDFQGCSFVIRRLQHRYFPVKFAKFIKTPFLPQEHLQWPAATEAFYKDFVDISYENFSCGIQEALLWMHLIYFLITIIFWFVKYVFRSMGTLEIPPWNYNTNGPNM